MVDGKRRPPEGAEVDEMQRDVAQMEARLAAVARARKEAEDRNRPGLAVAISGIKYRLAQWRYDLDKKKYELRWGKAGE